MILRLLSVPVLAVLSFIALGGAMSALAGPPPLRGQMVDVGDGRRMHIICEGPADGGPTIVFEAGAFGLSADWGAVQQMTTARGWRSCAYDRAGMGMSDPADFAPDALHVTADLERLLRLAQERGPYILVGHSMAGLYLPLFANRYPDQVAGLVLVDATTRQASAGAATEGFVNRFSRASRWAAAGASLGLFKPVAGSYGDRIGLPPAAKAEKQRAFASGRHNRQAYAEVKIWQTSARQMLDAGPLDTALPVSVITAGPETPERAGRKAMQSAPAQQSRHGYFINIEAANHRSLLGLDHAQAIVEGIARARAARTS
jgi:pimeloyl-ACP methyl ester carboxylesterase